MRGRPIVENKAKLRAMRFTDEDWKLLIALGGAKWIREKLSYFRYAINPIKTNDQKE